MAAAVLHFSMKRIGVSILLVAIAAAGPAVADSITPVGVAACSGCHPVHADAAGALPRLTGRKPAEIVAAMRAFRSGQRSATVMDRIAKGFSDAEIRAIADWYSSQ
jgi:cytochrome c553